MFPAPPFSMFRYAIREVRSMPGRFHISSSWRSDPRWDSDEVDESLLRELDRILDRSDMVSSCSVDDVLSMETPQALFT